MSTLTAAATSKGPFVNARMYAATPSCEIRWKQLLRWVLDRADVDWAYLEHPAPQPLGALWSRDDLGAALMCGLPWSLRDPRPAIVAAPCPSPPAYGGRAVYWSDIVVAAHGPHRTLEDTFGGVVGYTVAGSLSGSVAMRRHLDRYRGRSSAPLYREEVDGLVNARGVIEAVRDGRIDVGPLDSYSHDLLARHEPALTASVRVVERTAARPIPPFVATAPVTADELRRLRAAFLATSAAPELADARADLLLAGFATVDEDAYRELASLAPSSLDD